MKARRRTSNVENAGAFCEGYFSRKRKWAFLWERWYWVLDGTTLSFYRHEDDARHMKALRGQVEVASVADWPKVPFGFCFNTTVGKVYYAQADDGLDKTRWVRAMQLALSATPPAGATSPATAEEASPPSRSRPMSVTGPAGRRAFSRFGKRAKDGFCVPPAFSDAPQCQTCGSAFDVLHRGHHCRNCGGHFCGMHSARGIPLPHYGFNTPARVCDQCYRAQLFLNYVDKMANGDAAEDPGEEPEDGDDDEGDAASVADVRMDPTSRGSGSAGATGGRVWRLGKTPSRRSVGVGGRVRGNSGATPPAAAAAAAAPAPQEDDETAVAAVRAAVAGPPRFTVNAAVLLLHRYLRGSTPAFLEALDALSALAEAHIDDVEFYWPQIVHLYLQVPLFSATEGAKAVRLEEFMHMVCQRSIHLALQQMWQLQGALEDSLQPDAPDSIADKYCRIVRFMLDTEAQMLGQEWDFPQSAHRSFGESLPRCTEHQRELITASIAKLHARGRASRAAEEQEEAAAAVVAASGRPALLRQQSSVGCASFQVFLLQSAMSDLSDDLDAEAVAPPPVPEESSSESPTTEPRVESEVLSRFFREQRAFIEALTDVAERMRFVQPPAARKDALPGELRALEVPELAYIPLCAASDSFRRVVRIPPDEGTVFTTHARAPTMIYFEVETRQTDVSAVFGAAGEGEEDVIAEEDLASVMDEMHLFDAAAPGGGGVEEVEGLVAAEDHLGASESDDDGDDDESGDQEAEAEAKEPEDQGTEQRAKPKRRQSLQAEVAARQAERHELTTPFGESWAEKKERMRRQSPLGERAGWDLVSMIAKSNDDLRQEVFCLQMLQAVKNVFARAQLPLWMNVYRIIATGSSTGLIETLTDAMSLDALKKSAGYTSLRAHFEATYGPAGSPGFEAAQTEYMRSLAAYSLACYVLQIKDRHNGNVLIDSSGHLVHIDFGFMLGIAPGGRWSIETAPFKLTAEMVDVLGGRGSDCYKRFVNLFTRGFLALRQHADDIITPVEVMADNSLFPCFANMDTALLVAKLRARFQLDLGRDEAVAFATRLINASYNNAKTALYDKFQLASNGIRP